MSSMKKSLSSLRFAASGARYDTLAEPIEEHKPADAGERIGADDVETDHKTDAETAVSYTFLPQSLIAEVVFLQQVVGYRASALHSLLGQTVTLVAVFSTR